MKRKISTLDLKIGMFVAELDRSWVDVPFEAPFQLQGYKVTSSEDIKKTQEFCKYVYIDPTLGIGSTRYIEDEHDLTTFLQKFEKLVDKAPEIYPDKRTVQEEAPKARQVVDDTMHVYQRVISDVQQGKTVDRKGVEKVVDSLVDSLTRNQTAINWLIRLKQQSNAAYDQSISVCVMALTFGHYLGIPKSELNQLGSAALLQDIGKIHLPTELLNKADPLTPAELKIVRSHVDMSVKMLRKQSNLPPKVIDIVYSHHERFDGSGYPRGLETGQIGILSTIAGLVDSYEAMMSDRPYREPKTSFQALMEIYDERDRLLPNAIVEQFIQCVGIFPVGSFVELTSGEVGVVVYRDRIQQLKPKVMIILDKDGRKISEPETINLASQYVVPDTMPKLVNKVIDPKIYDIDPSYFFA
ncbi:HD-GYP domain-containing protein [Pseudomonadota bacterium]